MSIPSGVNRQVIYAKEVAGSWGVPAAAGSGKYLRRTTIDLSLTRDTYESSEISSTAQTLDARNGMDKVDGSLKTEISVGSYSDFWAALLRGAWTPGVTFTGTTVSAVGASSKIVRGAGSWITDGFRVGKVVGVSGFATAANNGHFTILSLTATEMVVDATLTTEAAGASVTVKVLGKTLQIPLLPSARTNDSFTIEQYFDTIGVSRVATGIKVNKADVKVAPNSMATCDFGFMGKGMTTSSSAYFTTPAAASTTGVMSGSAGALYVGGVKKGVVTSFDCSIDGGMETGTIIGSRQAADIFLGRIKATGKFSIYFTDDTIFNAFTNETDVRLEVRLDDSDGNSFVLGFPRIKLGSAPTSDAEIGGITQDISFTALLNDGTDLTKEQSTVVLQDSSLV